MKIKQILKFAVPEDLEILVGSVIVAFIILLINFPTTINSIAESFPPAKSTQESQFFNTIASAKNSEKKFWSNIKSIYPQEEEISEQIIIDDTATTTATTTDSTNTDLSAKITQPAKIMMIGDSMILVGFGPSLESKLLKYQGISVVREGKYSTGLNRIDYYDWYKQTRTLINKHKPDVLIVMFGANDGQDIADEKGKSIRMFTTTKTTPWTVSSAWMDVYKRRIDNYLKEFAPKVKRIYWIGHPIPKTMDFYSKFIEMNKAYKEISANYENVEYINSWDRFAVNGKYSPTLADKNGLVQTVKQSDGVHVTVHGGNILADLVLGQMDEVELVKE